jgi:hypothetical protein
MNNDLQSAPVGRRDVLPLLLLSLTCFGFVWFVTSTWGEAIVNRSIGGRWFQSDGWRVYDDMVDWAANHHRANIRPLFSLISIPVTALISKLSGVRGIDAIWIFNAACMSVWAGGLYLTVRTLGAATVPALLAGALGAASASAMYWFIVPETYALSSMCLVLLLLLAAVEVRRPQGRLVWIASGTLVACTLASNILAVFVLSFCMKPRKEALQISAAVIALFVAALFAQRVILPTGATVRPGNVEGESGFVLHPDSGGPACIAAAVWISPLIAPGARTVGEAEATGHRVSVQCMQPASGPLRLAAAALWLGVFAWGVAALFRRRDDSGRLRRFTCGVLGALALNSLLHMVYGEETFLYALHFTPYLLVLASGIFLLPRYRRLPQVLAGVLLCLFAVLNFQQLHTVLTTHDADGTDARVTERLGPAAPGQVDTKP